jgi:hypothetical protein
MSSNRLLYDACEYKQRLHESVSSLDFLLDPIQFEHNKKCRIELGSVGGTNVSHVKGNLIDLENDLRGQNRPSTNCAEYKYIPNNKNYIQGKEYIKPVQHPKVDTTMQHLKSCQLVDYKEVPNVQPMTSCKNN